MIRFASPSLTRRRLLLSAFSSAAALALPVELATAQDAAFTRWVANFKSHALARGVSEKTYDRVMNNVTPDTSVS